MSTWKYIALAFALVASGCAQFSPASKSSDQLVLEVTTIRLVRNALIAHCDYTSADNGYALDLAEVKVDTPGAYQNKTLQIAIPALDTGGYNRFVAAVPTRKETWALFTSENRKLTFQVPKQAVDEHLKIKDDKSRVLPSVDVFELKDIAGKP